MTWAAPLAAAASWETSFNEIRERFSTGLTPDAAYGVKVALVGVGLTCVLWLAKATPGWWRAVALFFAACAAALSVKLALAQAWLADDAFISFRYADNLARGEGLVWNVGERVEGYTNFLWTVVIALGQLIGIAPAYSSTAMTLSCLVLLAMVGTWKLSKRGWVPLAPVLLVIAPAFVEFGTSGLEAGPTALCVGIAALLLAEPERRHLSGWWILTAALLRPDHALFFAPLGLLQLFAGRKAILHTIGAGVAFGVYWLGRWAYFGELFPNTFHAKSGAGANWFQGSLYWAEFSLATGLWLAIPLVLLVAVVLAFGKRGAVPGASLVFALVGSSLFAVYVARIGGDFMEFRFGLTSYVLFALGADLVLSRLAGDRVWATVIAGLALVPLGLTPTLIKHGEKKWHIARESSYYRLKSWFPLELDTGHWATGKALASLPQMGANAPPLAAGCIGIVGYLSRVRIVDRYGLTNATIARKPIKERGRPGHEKWATDAELRAEGAEWTVDPAWEEPLKTRARFRVGNVNFWVLKHTPALAAALPVPPPSEILAGIRSMTEARDQQSAVSTLFAAYPDVIEVWNRQWHFVDPRQFKADGEAVEASLTRVTAKRALGLIMRRACPPTPHRLRWRTTKGACTPDEVRCEGNDELEAAVSCTGDEILLEQFSFEAVDDRERLMGALSLGAEAIADVIRDQGDSFEGMIARFRFDSAAELSRPELEGVSGLFDVTSKPAPGQGVLTGMKGTGLLNGFAKGGDGPKGKLKITVPVSPGKPVLVSFLFAGGFACDRVRAVLRDGPLELLKTCGRQDEVLRPASAIVTPAHDRLVLEVLDDEDKPWGHALVDEFFVWAMPPASDAAKR